MPSLRDIAKKLVPGSVRQLIKRKCEAQFIDPVDTCMTLGSAQGLPQCTAEGVGAFVAPEPCRNDLTYFTADPGGRSEFHGLARRAHQGGVFFDIGASSGIISALFCAANAKNRVYAFEPSPMLCARLGEVRQLNGFGDRMQIEQVAIGEKPGEMEMLIDPWSGFVQTQRFDNSMWTEPERIQVRIESIADASARLQVVPDCIKLDIEGFEYEAVKGAREFLARHRPAIFVELHLGYLRQRHLSPGTVVEMLQGCGYKFSTYGGRPLTAGAIAHTPLANIHFLARV
jgi:FkbM family methyltransferase